MTITVTGPDNITVSFPDGTNASVINDVMTKHFGGGASKASSPITAGGLARAAAEGIPVVGGLLNKANAATYAGLAPLFPGDTTVSHAPSFGERYSENLAKENAKSSQFETEHPIASTAAGLAGGVGATLPLAATGAGARLLGLTGRTLPAQMMQGAASGAAINAADALTRGNDIGTAAGIGGAIGGAAPAVARGVGALFSPYAESVRGIINPDRQAAREVGGAIGQAQQRAVATPGNPRNPLTPAEFNQARAEGVPVAVLDMAGEPGRRLARTAANLSPEAGDILNQPLDARFAAQSDRLSDWLRSTFHYPDAAAQSEALRASQSAANNTNYARAMADGAHGLWSPELESLASSPIFANAMKKAAGSAADEAVISGYAGMNPKISFTPDGRIQFARGPSGVPTYPDLHFWDLTRRQLSNAAQMAIRQGDREGARQFGLLAQRLNTELDRQVPSYAAARAGHAAFAGAQDALEAGRNFATQRTIDNRTARTALMQMTPQEQQLFQDGFVDSLVQRIRSVPDQQNVVGKIANSRAAQEQMQIALGRDRANQLQAMLHLEGIMNMGRQAVQGNSTTARQVSDMLLASGGDFLSGGNPFDNPMDFVKTAIVAGGLRAGHQAAARRVAPQIARLLASNDPAQVNLAMQMAGRNQQVLASLRAANAAIARVGSVQAQPDQRNR